MRAMFPNAELVVTVQTSPTLHMSLAIYSTMKIPKEIWLGGELYKHTLKASVKDSFYYEGELRMFSAPRAKILKPL
jgi:hypothetical protein